MGVDRRGGGGASDDQTLVDYKFCYVNARSYARVYVYNHNVYT